MELLKGIQHTSYLFEQHSSYPLHDVYVDNLVQICPKHATHDTIPVPNEKIASFS